MKCEIRNVKYKIRMSLQKYYGSIVRPFCSGHFLFCPLRLSALFGYINTFYLFCICDSGKLAFHSMDKSRLLLLLNQYSIVLCYILESG